MQITATELSYIYNKKSKFATKALDAINLEIAEGDFFGIIGHTGSGKSTFVQHLNALLRATSGSLKIGAFDLSAKVKKLDYRALRSKVGLVFQYPEYQLFADTVANDVAFGLKNFCKDMPKAEQEQAVKAAIEIVGLEYENIKDRSPFELSGGQKRRVAIAGVLVSKPEILILDEPAAGLDPSGKKAVMELLHALHKSWCNTIIIISHDMDEIAENCNKAAVFHGGKIVLGGTPKEIFTEAEMLFALGLDIPTTAKLVRKLQARGIDIDCDFTVADFTEKLQQKLLNSATFALKKSLMDGVTEQKIEQADGQQIDEKGTQDLLEKAAQIDEENRNTANDAKEEKFVENTAQMPQQKLQTSTEKSAIQDLNSIEERELDKRTGGKENVE